MKETPLSICEKQTVIQAVKQGLRTDGRGLNERREIFISFGTEWGCCHVLLGNTRVIAQVSCSVAVPKSSRSNEGMLFISVEMSTMAAENFESGRLGQLGIEVTRLLERCIKDSHCVDLESLCILVEEQAWEIRVDVHILNHDGNLIDAATLAALGALCHFKRPDVTLDGRQVVIHPVDERDPVPLTILHHPLTHTFALFDKGKICILDPTNLEERSCDGKLVLGFNAYRELCALQISGNGVFINKDAVLSCANVAAIRAVEIVETLKKALAKDLKERSSREYSGLVECVALDIARITTQSQTEIQFKTQVEVKEVSKESVPTIQTKITNDDGVVNLEILKETDVDEDMSSDSEVESHQATNKQPQPVQQRIYEEIDIGDDSEEEPVMLQSSETK